MARIFRFEVWGLLVSLGISADCAALKGYQRFDQDVQPHSFLGAPRGPPRANAEEEPPVAGAANDGGQGAADEDTSCIPRNSNMGSSAPSLVLNTYARTLEDCRFRCRQYEECTHFTYHRLGQLCYVQHGAPQLKERSEADTGAPSCDTSCFGVGIRLNSKPLNEKPIKVRFPVECQAACAGTKDCKAFSVKDLQCFLHPRADYTSYKPVRGTIVGPKEFCFRGGVRLEGAKEIGAEKASAADEPEGDEEKPAVSGVDGAPEPPAADSRQRNEGEKAAAAVVTPGGPLAADTQKGDEGENAASPTPLEQPAAGSRQGAEEEGACFEEDMRFLADPARRVALPSEIPQDCQAACAADGKCVAFAAKRRQCLLYEKGFTPRRVHARGWVVGPKKLCSEGGKLPKPEKEGPPKCIKEPNTGSANRTLAKETARSLPDCLAACHKKRGCSHVVFKTMTAECQMKQGAPKYQYDSRSVAAAWFCDVGEKARDSKEALQ